jgi:Arc/MetJ family transcription regulator
LNHYDAKIYARVSLMRTTIKLDDQLMAAAQEYSGLTEKTEIVRKALKCYVEREASRRLARLGGSCPDLVVPPRRRFPAEESV